MSWILNELRRVEQYGKGLGIKTTYKEWKSGDPEADWVLDGTEITVYKRKGMSTTQIILDLVHEHAHHFTWIKANRTVPIKLDTALGRENPTKKQRKAILDDEKKAASFHEELYQILGLKIPLYKIQVERDLAIFGYKYWYQNNEWPNRKQKRGHKKELVKKYKP